MASRVESVRASARALTADAAAVRISVNQPPSSRMATAAPVWASSTAVKPELPPLGNAPVAALNAR